MADNVESNKSNTSPQKADSIESGAKGDNVEVKNELTEREIYEKDIADCNTILKIPNLCGQISSFIKGVRHERKVLISF